jgi:hypothetical protein
MDTYIVLYRDDGPQKWPYDEAFRCQGDDPDHAKEQCLCVYPGCEVLWVAKTGDAAAAYEDYWEYNRTPCSFII